MHGLGLRFGAPVNAFVAFAGQGVRSQSFNRPAYAGRGGAGDGAVLFVFW
jgi:hypothetical protein